METLGRKLRQLESIKADKLLELQTEESRTGKKPKNEFHVWSSDVATATNKFEGIKQEAEQGGWGGKLLGKRVKSLIEKVNELIKQTDRFRAGIVSDAPDNSSLELSAPKLVGQAFELNKKKIQQYIKEDGGLSIGIWGMGGVGKTTLVAHIYNELLREKKNVCWITVSQEFSISKLQNQIAKAIGCDISRENDEKKRAAILWDSLRTKPKFVLILDDLWQHFPLEKLGIPNPRENGCKLIITTRSSEVSNKMCQKNIKLELLSEVEAWNLFQEILGEHIPVDVMEISKSIVRECAGWPLGIIAMAGCMKGVVDLCEWRNTLRELKESKARESDMESEVFGVLKFSYDRLGSSALQKCFLYCALYPEDHEIEREELLDYLIDEGVIEERSRKAEFDKGRAMLDKLEKVCLLERVRDYENRRYVKMHDVIRDMAIQLMKPDTLVSRKSKVLECENSTADPLRISAMYGKRSEIHENFASINYLEISNLLLRDFKPNLSRTIIYKLPDPVSNLSNLTSLSLRGCPRITRVPSLENLKALKMLDLCYTQVEEIPQGLEVLSNLEYLGLFGTSLKELPPGILPKLSCLQVLLLDLRLTVKGVEVASLRKLETLYCRLYDFNEFNTYYKEDHGLSLRDRGIGSQQINNYFLYLGEYIVVDGECGALEEFVIHSLLQIGNFNKELEIAIRQTVILGECSVIGGECGALEEFRLLDIKSYQTRRLFLEYDFSMKELAIWSCGGIKCLFSNSSSFVLESLQKIQIMDLMVLRVLCSTITNGKFFHLKSFHMEECPRIKKLFPPGLLSNFQNLEEIYVSHCENLKELIVEEDQHHSNDSSFTLPKLHTFELNELPKLNSICSRKMICKSLRFVSVDDCRKLKRISLSLLSLDNGQTDPLPSLEEIAVSPREWWETVELEHPNAKPLLSPLVKYI